MPIIKKIFFRPFYSLVLISSMVLLSAQKTPSKEYQLKAAFLFNFSQFVEWPNSNSKTSIVIGILGEDPFGNYLNEMVKGEVVNNHSLIIQRYNTVEELKACDILFINLSSTIKLEKVFSAIKGKHILTVGETTDFIKEGGIIKFSMIDNKIHFQINPEAAKSEGLTISSKLLKLAEITIPKKRNN